jgi:uncharacterized protein YecE (DUF72 family)
LCSLLPIFSVILRVGQDIKNEDSLRLVVHPCDQTMLVAGDVGPKLGPMVFQFPSFDRWKFPKRDSFLAVLVPFLKKLPADHEYVIEIRNKTWLDARFADVLREHNVALALTDTSFMPRPWEMKEKFDLVTADFAYVRWLGDRKRIEQQTTTWDKTVIDRTGDLKNWVELLRRLVTDKRIRKILALMNNHYSRHAPAGVKLFQQLWDNKR